MSEPTMKMILFIAAGGAMGALGRYFVVSQAGHWLGFTFPYGTLIVNILGSFILGSLTEIMALSWSVSQETRAFLVVGLLGAFTTFSAFSLDVVYLFERGETASAAVYIAASVVLAIAAFMLGLRLFRFLLT
ncbi:MAG: fluoride efflux transporter CrcB [Rhodospirillales bacterium]